MLEKEEKLKDNKIYNTALYCRLSLDDGSVGESGSIQTQKIILEEYAKMHGFKIYDVYVDDGYSGLSFNRPGFQRMIKEYQEEQKKITSEIETLKNLKQEEESTIENYKLLKEKVNEFLEFKELNFLIVHSLISRIEVGYRDNPRTIKIYYKFINDSISN